MILSPSSTVIGMSPGSRSSRSPGWRIASAGKIRQAQFVLPNIRDWKGLKLKAEIEVKGMRYPVRWACHQSLNNDGSLTLRPNIRADV